jgi:hypothetical protein
MYYEDQSLPELHYMTHLHDVDEDYVKYDETILNSTLSPYIFSNDLMNGFLQRLQKLVTILFDNFNIVKNFKNYHVDKYYYKHKH